MSEGLTLATTEGIIEQIHDSGRRRLDLRAVEFIDPYGLIVLDLVINRCRRDGLRLEVDLPEDPRVRSWMNAMGFFANSPSAFGPKSPTRTRPHASTLQPITRIRDEEGVSRLVDRFDARLSSRYPNMTAARKSLLKTMVELFQNVPQHANADGTIPDFHGVAALQDYEDSIVLAVGDIGIGLRGSLSLREGFARITDKQALWEILERGTSRFAEEGRGGELKNIVSIVNRHDGDLVIRSGSAMIYMDHMRGYGVDVHDVVPFAGVQIGIRLPRESFEWED